MSCTKKPRATLRWCRNSEMEGMWTVSLCRQKLFPARQLHGNLRVVQEGSVGYQTVERESEITKIAALQCRKVVQPCKRELFREGLGFSEVTTRTGWPQPRFQATSGALGGSRACCLSIEWITHFRIHCRSIIGWNIVFKFYLIFFCGL
jgi:hypothetical protein